MSIPDAARGQPISHELWNRLVAEVNRNRIILAPGGGLQGHQTVGGVVLQAAPCGSSLTYIQLTGPAGPDGGYPWAEVTQAPPIKVTNGGSGYTSAPSVTVS